MHANIKKGILSFLVIAGLISYYFAFATVVQAASLTSVSDTMTRQIISDESDHTILFTSPTGVAAGQTITVTFPAGFDLATNSVAFGDLDLEDDAADLTLAAAPAGATWGAAIAGQVITFTSGTGTIGAGSVIGVKIGTSADSGANQIINHGTASAGASTYTVEIGGTFGDTGAFVIPILNDDQIHVTAEVAEEFTFQLHDAADDSGSSLFTDHANIIDFGTLSSSAVQFAVEGAGSGGAAASVTGGAHGIKAGTNGAGGYSITVAGATLTSGANTITAIGAAAAASSVGSEQFGICLSDDTTGVSGTTKTDATQQGTIVAAFDCGGTGYAYDASATNSVAGGNASGPTSMTFYDVQYVANISALTEAGNYTADLTWIGTGTF